MFPSDYSFFKVYLYLYQPSNSKFVGVCNLPLFSCLLSFEGLYKDDMVMYLDLSLLLSNDFFLVSLIMPNIKNFLLLSLVFSSGLSGGCFVNLFPIFFF